MPVSEERRQLLEGLAAAVQVVLPDGAEYHRHEEAANNFIVSWRFPDRSGLLTTVSREISIRFREGWLDEYKQLVGVGRETANNFVRRLVRNKLRQYDDGSNMDKYAYKEPFIITVPDDLD